MERYQNPAVGDQINLRLFMYNSNNLSDLDSVEKVDIYFLDPAAVSANNTDGRTLVESFPGASVTHADTGTYSLRITAEDVKYTIGSYIDVWTVSVYNDQPAQTIQNKFQIYPNLWYSTPIPVVYNFSFRFQPNKLRKGARQYLIVEILPNVPTAGDLRQYYENIAIVSDLTISVEKVCGDCLPAEKDLRLLVDEAPVDFREKRFGYYQLDTTALGMEEGIYDIWFTMDFGSNHYVSERFHFQIFE